MASAAGRISSGSRRRDFGGGTRAADGRLSHPLKRELRHASLLSPPTVLSARLTDGPAAPNGKSMQLLAKCRSIAFPDRHLVSGVTDFSKQPQRIASGERRRARKASGHRRREVATKVLKNANSRNKVA